MFANSLNYQNLQEISKYKSEKGTCLITYYVPSNSDMSLVSNHFKIEMSSAQNIKDKNVRENVKASIRSIQALLKTTPHTTPENGYVILAGETESYL